MLLASLLATTLAAFLLNRLKIPRRDVRLLLSTPWILHFNLCLALGHPHAGIDAFMHLHELVMRAAFGNFSASQHNNLVGITHLGNIYQSKC